MKGLRRVTLIGSGATEFLPGAFAEQADFETQIQPVRRTDGPFVQIYGTRVPFAPLRSG